MSKCKYCDRGRNAKKLIGPTGIDISDLVKKNCSIKETKLKIIIALSQYELFYPIK